jgi:hypothetical protein
MAPGALTPKTMTHPYQDDLRYKIFELFVGHIYHEFKELGLDMHDFDVHMLEDDELEGELAPNTMLETTLVNSICSVLEHTCHKAKDLRNTVRVLCDEHVTHSASRTLPGRLYSNFAYPEHNFVAINPLNHEASPLESGTLVNQFVDRFLDADNTHDVQYVVAPVCKSAHWTLNLYCVRKRAALHYNSYMNDSHFSTALDSCAPYFGQLAQIKGDGGTKGANQPARDSDGILRISVTTQEVPKSRKKTVVQTDGTSCGLYVLYVIIMFYCGVRPVRDNSSYVFSAHLAPDMRFIKSRHGMWGKMNTLVRLIRHGPAYIESLRGQ